MIGYLLVLLLALPFIDFYLLFVVAESIGFVQTIGVILLTGIIGAHLIRREGIHILMKLQQSVTAGEASRNMVEGAMIVFAGIFLLTPGLITDLAGIALVFRPLRERLVAKLMNSSDTYFEVRSAQF
ncbi:MAG: UPF0716 protein FxsA [Candidatus Nanohaloarchaea archaeon]|jgi:UPF0716 protein FxsA